jgi:hypothetical protein
MRENNINLLKVKKCGPFFLPDPKKGIGLKCFKKLKILKTLSSWMCALPDFPRPKK